MGRERKIIFTKRKKMSERKKKRQKVKREEGKGRKEGKKEGERRGGGTKRRRKEGGREGQQAERRRSTLPGTWERGESTVRAEPRQAPLLLRSLLTVVSGKGFPFGDLAWSLHEHTHNPQAASWCLPRGSASWSAWLWYQKSLS